MRKLSLLLLIVLAGVGAYLGYTRVYLPTTSPPPTPTLAQEMEQLIWASGEVVPARWATLSFSISGQLTELLVAEGTQVRANQLLAGLDATELEHQRAIALAALRSAQAEVVRLQAPVRPAEISQALAGVAAARAARTTAQARLDQARAKLAGLLSGARPEEVEAASAALLKAEAAMRQAQAEYDKIAWAGDVAQSPQALALQSATLDFNTAKANYQALLAGARPAEVQAAQAEVAAARAGLDAAEAEVQRAVASVQLLRAGHSPQEIAVAQAAVEQATATLDATEAALSKARLVAPFTGTVTRLWIRRGEQVSAGAPVLTLADLSSLHVETTDLRETDVAQLRIGQPVDVTFDALPDAVIKGHITWISPQASKEKGGVAYLTRVELAVQDSRLRWGMTAYVNISLR